MIKARKLFLVPSLSMFLILIPFIGIFLTALVCYIWYDRNTAQIHSYFRGVNYEQNETSDEELESLK
tara:strand:- start:242 stop:442 length:201 start_codon:yes stop_codon:yes gene_type:complete